MRRADCAAAFLLAVAVSARAEGPGPELFGGYSYARIDDASRHGADTAFAFGLKAPRTTEAFAKGRAEFDPEKRVAIYKEMQRAALEEVPIIGLAWRSQGYGMDKRVQGFKTLPGALTTASGALLDEVSFG